MMYNYDERGEKSVAVRNTALEAITGKNQQLCHQGQIKINYQALTSASATPAPPHEEEETFCNWCGKTIPHRQAADYLDIKVCSLRCGEDYRKNLIEKNLLKSCDCCGADILEKSAVRNYADIGIGEIDSPYNQNDRILITGEDISVLGEHEIQNAISTYCNQFFCCKPECMSKLMQKDETIRKYCEYLTGSYEIFLIYEIAVKKFNYADFDNAEILFNRIPQYKDAAQKSADCRKLIDQYTALIKEFKPQFDAVESELFNPIQYNYPAAKANFDRVVSSFSDHIPAEHRRYQPVAEIFAMINKQQQELEDAASPADAQSPADVQSPADAQSSSTIFILIAFCIAFVFIVVGLKECSPL